VRVIAQVLKILNDIGPRQKWLHQENESCSTRRSLRMVSAFAGLESPTGSKPCGAGASSADCQTGMNHRLLMLSVH
jgi:hypothetical protein